MFLCRMSWYPFGMPLAASVEGLLYGLTGQICPRFQSLIFEAAVKTGSPVTQSVSKTSNLSYPGNTPGAPGFTLARCGGKKGGEKEQKLFPDSPSDPIPQ